MNLDQIPNRAICSSTRAQAY